MCKKALSKSSDKVYLKYLEKNFATDKTGERTKTYSSWYSIRCNKETKKRDHINVHITSGCELHAVTAIDVLVEKEWFEKPKALNFIKFSNAKIYQ